MSLVDFNSGQSRFRVFVDGEEVSSHTTEREAAEVAADHALLNIESDIYYDHDYRVDVKTTRRNVLKAAIAAAIVPPDFEGGDAEAGVIVVEPDLSSQWSAPTRFSGFPQYMIDMNILRADTFAAQGSDINSSDYSEANSFGGTTFYSAWRTAREYEDWVTNTGQTGAAIDQVGLRRMLTVQVERWGNPVGVNTIRQAASDVLARAYDEGAQYELNNIGGALTNVTLTDIEDHTESSQGSTGPFNFTSLSEFQLLDTYVNTSAFRGPFANNSRRVSFACNQSVDYERYLGTPRLGFFDATKEWLPEMFECHVNHLYRWMREDWDIGGVTQDYPANFMMGLTIDSIWRVWEFFEDEGRSINSELMPSTVFSGNVVTTTDEASIVTCPWTDWRTMLNEFLEWQWQALDGTHTVETGVWPQPSVDYFRVYADHTASTGAGPGTGGPRSIGDPMCQTLNDGISDYAITYYRTNDAYVTQNIQMLNAGGLYWAAYVNHLAGDTANRDKQIRWGDLLLAGCVQLGTGGTNIRAKNEQNYTIWKGGLLRDAITGRNDFGGNP